jgi:HlyD family secretion protein
MNISTKEARAIRPDETMPPAPNTPFKPKRSPAVPAILGVIALLGVGLFMRSRGGGSKPAEGPRGPQTRTVRVIPVATGTIVERLAVTGSLRANQNIDLNPKISGRVAAVYVNEGQRVRRGQLLATLDEADLRESVNSARANLRTQQVRLQQTVVGLPARVAQVGSNIETARAQVATARARYQQALLNEPTQIANAQSQVETAREGVNSATSRVRQARDTARQTQLQVNAGIASAQSALAQSSAQLEQIRNGARAQQVASAQAQVTQAQAQVANAEAQLRDARTNLTRQTVLFEGGATAKANVDSAETQFSVAQTQLDVARAQLEAQRQNLSLVREGSRTEEVRAAEEVVNQRQAALRQAQAERGNILTAQQAVTQALAAQGQAQEALRTAQSNLSTIPITRQETRTALEAVRQAETGLRQAVSNRSQIPVAQQDVPAARAAVQSAQVQLNQALLQLSYARIFSPINGTVNTKNTDIGESASPGTPLFNLVSSDNVYFEAQIPESQLARIKINQPAQVTVGAVSDRPIIGYVSDIIRVADPQLRQFRLRITLPNSGNLTPGAFARGQLQTQVISNTLTLPNEVIRTESGKDYVLVAIPAGEGATVKRREVQTGTSAGGQTQILGGVRAGDRVITGNTIFEDNDKVRLAREDGGGRSGGQGRRGGESRGAESSGGSGGSSSGN